MHYIYQTKDAIRCDLTVFFLLKVSVQTTWECLTVFLLETLLFDCFCCFGLMIIQHSARFANPKELEERKASGDVSSLVGKRSILKTLPLVITMKLNEMVISILHFRCTCCHCFLCFQKNQKGQAQNIFIFMTHQLAQY